MVQQLARSIARRTTEPDGPDLFENVAIVAGLPHTPSAGLTYLGLDSYASVELNESGNLYIDVTDQEGFCNTLSFNLTSDQLITYEYAQWLAFDSVYLNPTFQVLSNLGAGIGTPALFGAFIDTALNEGEDEFHHVLNQMDCSQYTCNTALGYAAQFSLARKIDVDNTDLMFNQYKNGCLRTSTWYNFSAFAPTLSGATANAVFHDLVIPIRLWGPYENPPIYGTECSYATPGE